MRLQQLDGALSLQPHPLVEHEVTVSGGKVGLVGSIYRDEVICSSELCSVARNGYKHAVGVVGSPSLMKLGNGKGLIYNKS